MVPEKAQAEQTAARWEADGVGVDVVCASPYKGTEHIARAASSLRGRDYPFVCLDCMPHCPLSGWFPFPASV